MIDVRKLSPEIPQYMHLYSYISFLISRVTITSPLISEVLDLDIVQLVFRGRISLIFPPLPNTSVIVNQEIVKVDVGIRF